MSETKYRFETEDAQNPFDDNQFPTSDSRNEVTSLEDVPIDLLIELKIRATRFERVPVNNLVFENSLVESQHVEELAESINGPRGQISPLVVSLRVDEGVNIVYDLIDGFHRAHALAILNWPFADCKVIYGCTDEEMFDLRILSASSVRTVSFARRAAWMQESFLNTKWQSEGIYEKIITGSLTLSQIFSLAANNSTGTGLKLSRLEALEIKHWAKTKAKMWKLNPGSIAQELKVVESASPELIREVRINAGGGKGGKGVLSYARLKAIVDCLPGEFDLQKTLAALAVEQNIVAKGLGIISAGIAGAKSENNWNEINRILSNPTNFLDQQKKIEKTREMPPQEKEGTSTKELREKTEFLARIIKVQQEMIRLLQRRDSLDFSRNKVVSGMYAFLERKLQTLGHGTGTEFSPIIILDKIPEVEFDCINGKVFVEDMWEVELTTLETDILWILLFFEGRKISSEVITFLTESNLYTEEVIQEIRKKLNQVVSELGDNIVSDKDRYTWKRPELKASKAKIR